MVNYIKCCKTLVIVNFDKTLNLPFDIIITEGGIDLDYTDIVKKSIAFIHCQYNEPIFVTDVASHVYLSPSHLEDETSGKFFQYFFKTFLRENNLSLPDAVIKKMVTHIHVILFLKCMINILKMKLTQFRFMHRL